METGADLEQAADAAFDLDLAAGEGGDPGEDLKQGAAADEAEAVVFAEVFDLDDDVGHDA